MPKRSSDEINNNEVLSNNKRSELPVIFNSEYWSVKLRHGDKIECICGKCGSVYKGKSSSTGNFNEHYKRKHPQDYNSYKLFRESRGKVLVEDENAMKMRQTTLSLPIPTEMVVLSI